VLSFDLYDPLPLAHPSEHVSARAHLPRSPEGVYDVVLRGASYFRAVSV
jgi:hypothetical protein